jgi:hypothetical protein
MSQPLELQFTEVRAACNALWDLGGKVVMDPGFGDHDNWLLEYRQGLRGMLARILAVDRHFRLLHDYQRRAEEAPPPDPNEWLLECEYHAGLIFFGMDSSLECFVYALNAIGCAKSPTQFCDITTPSGLKQVRPENVLGGPPGDRRNPRPGYRQHFPRVVALWEARRALLDTIFEYHNVSKHRQAAATGGGLGELRIRGTPKQPGSLMSSTEHTVQSLARDYQEFMDELLSTAVEETGAAFGYTMVKRPLRPPQT